MNYCQFINETIKRMCNSVKPLLPPEYQQVEYLQSSGTQYIEIGSLANHQYFDLDVEVTGYNQNVFFNQYGLNGILGCNAHNASTDVKVWVRNTNAISFSINNVALGSINDMLGNRYKVYFSPTLVTCNGVQINTDTTTAITSTVNCYVFAINNIGTYGQDYPELSKLKLYRLKTGLIDTYPCYRQSDNKPGMYDIVSDTFFTNAGTGEFTVGNDVL